MLEQTTVAHSILPVRAFPEIWLGPRGHVGLNSLGNDPSVCNFLQFSVETVHINCRNRLFIQGIPKTVKKC